MTLTCVGKAWLRVATTHWLWGVLANLNVRRRARERQLRQSQSVEESGEQGGPHVSAAAAAVKSLAVVSRPYPWQSSGRETD